MGGMAWAFNVVPKGFPLTPNNSVPIIPECVVCSERKVSGGRGGRLGKKDLDYTSLLIAKPVEFSDEFDLRIRSREKGIQVVENALEAMREEGREMFDGMGLVAQDNVMQNACMDLVIEKTQVIHNHFGTSGTTDSKDAGIPNQIEGWREKTEKRAELEYSPIKFELQKVASDTESLVLLNECWEKH